AAPATAASRIRGSPASWIASVMVVGSPRPMPYGVRTTNRDSRRAHQDGRISQVKYDRPWATATTFSLQYRYHALASGAAAAASAGTSSPALTSSVHSG